MKNLTLFCLLTTLFCLQAAELPKPDFSGFQDEPLSIEQQEENRKLQELARQVALKIQTRREREEQQRRLAAGKNSARTPGTRELFPKDTENDPQ